ncbi:unnamed protein product, partial [Trichogramma brassicae]
MYLAYIISYGRNIIDVTQCAAAHVLLHVASRAAHFRHRQTWKKESSRDSRRVLLHLKEKKDMRRGASSKNGSIQRGCFESTCTNHSIRSPTESEPHNLRMRYNQAERSKRQINFYIPNIRNVEKDHSNIKKELENPLDSEGLWQEDYPKMKKMNVDTIIVGGVVSARARAYAHGDEQVHRCSIAGAASATLRCSSSSSRRRGRREYIIVKRMGGSAEKEELLRRANSSTTAVCVCVCSMYERGKSAARREKSVYTLSAAPRATLEPETYREKEREKEFGSRFASRMEKQLYDVGLYTAEEPWCAYKLKVLIKKKTRKIIVIIVVLYAIRKHASTCKNISNFETRCLVPSCECGSRFCRRWQVPQFAALSATSCAGPLTRKRPRERKRERKREEFCCDATSAIRLGRERLYNISARRASLHVNAAVMMDNARGYRLCRGSIAQIGERARTIMDKSEKKFEEDVSKNNLSEHEVVVSDNKQHVCDICQKTFKLESSIIIHRDTTHNEEKNYVCDKCDKKFEFRSHLSRHQIWEHKGFKDLACDKCEKKFEKKSTLFTHQKLVHKDREDFICNKTVHEGRKDYKCDKCEQKFGHRGNLLKHIKTVHEGRKAFACDKCEKKFTHKHNLLCHQKIVHENRKDFSCDSCDQKFGRKWILLQHQKTVHEGQKDYVCDKCEKKFGDRSNFNRHQNIVHEGRKDYVCDKCEKKFGHRGGLLFHQKTVHEGHKDYACLYCEKIFGHKGNLLTHIKTVHEGRKDYVCDKCEMKFTQKSSLFTHLKTIHEGLKDYTCDNCEQKFTRKSSFLLHQKTVHEGRKDYACDKCEKKFGFKHNLINHKRTVHEGLNNTIINDFGTVSRHTDHVIYKKYLYEEIFNRTRTIYRVISNYNLATKHRYYPKRRFDFKKSLSKCENRCKSTAREYENMSDKKEREREQRGWRMRAPRERSRGVRELFHTYMASKLIVSRPSAAALNEIYLRGADNDTLDFAGALNGYGLLVEPRRQSAAAPGQRVGGAVAGSGVLAALPGSLNEKGLALLQDHHLRLQQHLQQQQQLEQQQQHQLELEQQLAFYHHHQQQQQQQQQEQRLGLATSSAKTKTAGLAGLDSEAVRRWVAEAARSVRPALPTSQTPAALLPYLQQQQQSTAQSYG